MGFPFPSVAKIPSAHPGAYVGDSCFTIGPDWDITILTPLRA
jgi:hypothetical protein